MSCMLTALSKYTTPARIISPISPDERWTPFADSSLAASTVSRGAGEGGTGVVAGFERAIQPAAFPLILAAPATASARSTPAPGASPAAAAGGGTSSSPDAIPDGLHIARVSGRQGRFTALLVEKTGAGLRQTEVRVGDKFEGSKVVGIDMSGVRLRDADGERRIPFRPNPLLVGLTTGGIGNR
jgi:hypothetical protein